jgi:hypothetical protein
MFSASVSIDITGIQGSIMDKNAVNYGQNNKLSIDKNNTCQYNFYR